MAGGDREETLLGADRADSIQQAPENPLGPAVATMERNCLVAAASGAVLCAASAAGMYGFMRAEWFTNPGPYPSNAWEGYDKPTFVGLCLFSFCGPVGYVLMYLGTVNGAHATGKSAWVAAQTFLAVASLVTGVAALVTWGSYAMSCLGMFCLGDIHTEGSPYHEVLNLRPESGLGWLMTCGVSIGFSFIPFGLILLYRTYRNHWASTSVAPVDQAAVDAADPCRSCTRPDGHGAAPVRLWIEFVVSLVCICIFAMTTLYIPNSWEFLTAPRIAKNAQFIASMDYRQCSYEKNTYICTEMPWAWFWTTNLRVSEYLNLKLYPSNMFFFGYVLLTMFGAAIMTHSGRRMASWWSQPLLSTSWLRLTRSEAAGTGLFGLFMLLFTMYWQQSHNYDGYYPNYDNTTLGGNLVGITWSERWARTMGQLAQALLGLLLFAAYSELRDGVAVPNILTAMLHAGLRHTDTCAACLPPRTSLTDVSSGVPPLHRAAAAGHLDCLRKILCLGEARGVRLQLQMLDVNGSTPLHIAAAHDRTGDMCSELVTFGADVNGRMASSNWTPLHCAAFAGQAKAAAALLQFGALVNAVALGASAGANTPLVVVLLHVPLTGPSLRETDGFVDTANVLLTAGAKANGVDAHGRHPLQILPARRALLEAPVPDTPVVSVLHAALTAHGAKLEHAVVAS